MRILVDSSVWIDYFNNARNSGTDQLDFIIGSRSQICLCPPVVQEVLQGFKSETDYNNAARLLGLNHFLKDDAYEAAHGAAQIFRNLRKKGFTIRKGSDCLIAWYALQNGCSILHRDRDFDLMAKPLALRIFK